MTSLQNKTALVTGASRGIGRATALALAEAGAHVLVHYSRSIQGAESLVAAIQAKGGRANAISADLGTPDGAVLLTRQVRFIVGDRLDVLVLNAGISQSARIADYTAEDFDSLFATNVRGPFFLVQATPARSRRGFKHRCYLLCGSSYSAGQARLGKSFDPRLCLYQMRT
jgi:3-oxoacyl-[acyl-carrier protein] reductase